VFLATGNKKNLRKLSKNSSTKLAYAQMPSGVNRGEWSRVGLTCPD
jgi:hypothetical protein